MSKKIMIICDICKREITDEWIYKFKCFNHRNEMMGVRHMCMTCREKFLRFVEQETKKNER